ncbi:lipoprotein [Paenilisteria newyorkensis]|nr:lipoprotein [Listeria newyorkensis]
MEADDLAVGDKIKVYFSPPVVVKETDPGQISANYIKKIVKSD